MWEKTGKTHSDDSHEVHNEDIIAFKSADERSPSIINSPVSIAKSSSRKESLHSSSLGTGKYLIFFLASPLVMT